MELVDKIIKGERAAIAKAITLVESSKDTDQQISRQLISELIKKPGKSIRVNISTKLLATISDCPTPTVSINIKS